MGEDLVNPFAAPSLEALIIVPLPFQVLFGGILLIVQLVQTSRNVLFSLLPPLFRDPFRMVYLIIVIVFLSLESVFSSLPLGVKAIIRRVLRTFVIFF